MAVKKSTAKKVVAKKSATKKAAPKKSVKKKPLAKKSAVKKSAVKKSAKKKSAAKKSIVKKTAVKKSAAKKSVKKKSATKKSSAKKSVDKIVIPELPVPASRAARVEVSSTPAPVSAPVLTPAPTTVPIVSSTSPTPPVAKKQGPSSRVLFGLLVGIVVIGLIAWAQIDKPAKQGSAKPSTTPTAAATMSNSESEGPAKPTPKPTSAAPAASETPTAAKDHDAPENAIGNYTANGLLLNWKAPYSTDGLTGFNVEISSNGGKWKIISTLPPTQLYLDLTKSGDSGWTSVRVSSVYSDDVVVPAKAFGFPGQFS